MMNSAVFEQSWEAVKGLATQFSQNLPLYLSAGYQEAEVRKYFLDKFFKALGWDVDHEQNSDPYKREVRIEKPEKKARGRADYAFSLAPHYRRVRFFAEAKRPQSSIGTPDNCFQAIRYSWPKGLPITILTDFNSLHVVDSRFRPNINTAASRVVRSWSYTDYLDKEKFAEIYYLFSREAVANGSIESFAENELPTVDAAVKQYTLFAADARDFDDDFLIQLDAWRTDLASAFKKTRNDLTGEQLTECVQRTLDRLIFTRFLEDKQVEQEPVVAAFGHGARTAWQDFVVASKRLNRTYNGIVFKPHTTLDDPGFAPDAGVFQSICDELTDAHSPYNFDSIPVEILGRVYERFLGKVVEATPKRVKIVEKEDVRRAGGVYYTPEYIVSYMVEQSLRGLVEGKSAKDILALRIIDTSCGSGSFLVGAFGFLLQTLTAYWQGQKRVPKGVVEVRDGDTHLTLHYKRVVLLSCIYGVDIDAQAVEVAQLSLYLKLMEEETTHSASQQQLEISEALLPSLTRNVVVGNSLVTPEDDDDLFSPELLGKVRPLDFKATFAQAFRDGGFDLVIGNPPYIKEYTNREAFDHVRSSPYYLGKMDIWYLFASRGLDWVKQGQGKLAFIATNNWVTNAGARKLREKIAGEARIEYLIDFGDFKVFRDAGIQTMILIAVRDQDPPQYTFDYRKLEGPKRTLADARGLLEKTSGLGRTYLTPMIDRSSPSGAPLTFSNSVVDVVLKKIEAKRNFTLDGGKEIAQGIVAPQDRLNAKSAKALGGKIPVGTGIFNLTGTELKALQLTDKELALVKPFYTSAELGRYAGNRNNAQWVIYTDSSFKNRGAMKSFPSLKGHLDRFTKVITSSNHPYGLHRARDENFFVGNKIASLRKCALPTFTYTDFPCYVSQSFNVIKTDRVDLLFLTGLLNSRVVRFWLRSKGKMQGENYQVDKEPLEGIPLCVPPKEEQQRIAKLVRRVVDHRLSTNASKTDAAKEQVLMLIEQVEEQINASVEALYGLDQDDVSVIEACLRGPVASGANDIDAEDESAE
jgi:adenine-specific DNA-methyltransferase